MPAEGIREALTKLGLDKEGLPWEGGSPDPEFKSGHGLPTLAEAVAANTPLSQLVGGGALAMLRTAKLPTLKLGTDPSGNIPVRDAAHFIALWVGHFEWSDAIAITLATPTSAGTGAGPVVTARDELRSALGRALDAVGTATSWWGVWILSF